MTPEERQRLAAELLERLPRSPDVYPQRLDLGKQRVLLIELDFDEYRRASFLDDRILSPSTRGAWVTLSDVLTAATAIPARPGPHFIWHSGHVGSTLVSRLLDSTGAVLSIREPLPLRAMAGMTDSSPLEALIPSFLRLWSRVYDTDRRVIVKGTSSASRIASRLMLASPDARSLCVNVGAEAYLATLLAGENSHIDLRGHAPQRAHRLAARIGRGLPSWEALSIGELAALSWLTETLTQDDLRSRYPGRVLAVDFDAFLADVPDHLSAIAQHFGIPPENTERAIQGAGAVLARYSKSPDLPFTPADRQEVLAQSRSLHRAEIARGMAWLETRARENPDCAAAFSR